MEFSLLSKRGVPEDAIISIRSGNVRRQGAVSADKPFRFPQNVSDADCVVKVDIMQNIGSGYLVMRPNQTEGKQYEVVLGGESSEMACELEVKPADAGCLASESPEDATAAAKSKQDAKMYLENTGLLPFVQGVLQVIAKQQPTDPFAAMAKHFLIASDEATPSKPGSPKAAPASPKVVAETPAPAEAAPEGGAKVSPPPEGEAAQELEKAESDHVDDGKSDTLEEFTSPVKNGTLAAEDEATTEAEVADKAPAPGESLVKAVEEEAPKVAEEVAPAQESNATPVVDEPAAVDAKENCMPAEAEGEGGAAQPEAAEPAASGADKEEAAEEKKEGAE